MSNTQLLTTVYVETHRAADLVSQLWNAAHRNETLLTEQTREPLGELKRRLSAAHCAALELENRAKGQREIQPAP